MNETLQTQISAARRCGTPILGISTPDQPALVATLVDLFPSAPVVGWDIARGLRPLTKAAQKMFAQIKKDDQGFNPEFLQNPGEALTSAAPKFWGDDKNGGNGGAVLIMENMSRLLTEPVVIQALSNLRDVFKTNMRTVIILAPIVTLPAELDGDVIVLDEALPTRDELDAIVKVQHQNAGIDVPEDVTKAVDALLGLAAFTAEQVVAMSLTRTGLDLPALWERKRQAIERTPGLSVYRGTETFDSIGGCENIKQRLRRVFEGPQRPRVVVFLDEIEKGFAGFGSDSSGTTTGQLGYFLSYMEDKRSMGLMFMGHPGTSKSLIAKAAGNTFGVPTIQLDLGGMKDSLVGNTEARTRQALRVIDSVSQGCAMFLATCNSLGSLPPELLRRFDLGRYFFDLPTAEEREQIWSIHAKAFGLGEQERPEDEGWTGAEIRNACRVAYLCQEPLIEAAKQIVPIRTTQREVINSRQREAHGRYTSAAYAGPYQQPGAESDEAEAALEPFAGRGARRVTVEA